MNFAILTLTLVELIIGFNGIIIGIFWNKFFRLLSRSLLVEGEFRRQRSRVAARLPRFLAPKF